MPLPSPVTSEPVSTPHLADDDKVLGLVTDDGKRPAHVVKLEGTSAHESSPERGEEGQERGGGRCPRQIVGGAFGGRRAVGVFSQCLEVVITDEFFKVHTFTNGYYK